MLHWIATIYTHYHINYLSPLKESKPQTRRLNISPLYYKHQPNKQENVHRLIVFCFGENLLYQLYLLLFLLRYFYKSTNTPIFKDVSFLLLGTRDKNDKHQNVPATKNNSNLNVQEKAGTIWYFKPLENLPDGNLQIETKETKIPQLKPRPNKPPLNTRIEQEKANAYLISRTKSSYFIYVVSRNDYTSQNIFFAANTGRQSPNQIWVVLWNLEKNKETVNHPYMAWNISTSIYFIESYITNNTYPHTKCHYEDDLT